jgi:hypothetical protein
MVVCCVCLEVETSSPLEPQRFHILPAAHQAIARDAALGSSLLLLVSTSVCLCLLDIFSERITLRRLEAVSSCSAFPSFAKNLIQRRDCFGVPALNCCQLPVRRLLRSYNRGFEPLR